MLFCADAAAVTVTPVEAAAESSNAGASMAALSKTQSKVTGGRKFKQSWLTYYPWLEFRSLATTAASDSSATDLDTSGQGAVFCAKCSECERKNMFKFSSKKEDSFISRGFSIWKNALAKFKAHELNGCHRKAILKLAECSKGTDVCGQLITSNERDRALAKAAMLKIISSIRYLTR
jgi:hypothetical protein